MVLDSFYLKKEDSDIIENKIFGHCHVKCLADSDYAAIWRDRILENHISVRNLEVIDENDHRVILFNHNLNDAEIIYPNALMITVSKEELDASSRYSNETLSYPTSREVTFAVEPNPSELQDWLLSAKSGSSVHLLDLLTLFSVGDKILSAETLQDGTFQISQVSGGTENTIIEVTGIADYKVSIGLEEANLIANIL